MSGLIAINNNSSSLMISKYTVYNIDSINSEIVDVIDDNNKFKAYKYLIDNTYYYYVVDGIHNFWIDDLSLIGYSEIKEPVVGDIIIFGNYQQTTEEPEPIEWRVLEVDTLNRKVFLISVKILDACQYGRYSSTSTTGCTDEYWSTCQTRLWLNSTFLNTAFNSSEQNKIVTTHVETLNNPDYGTNGGPSTDDKLYCLSVQEARNKSYFANSSELLAEFTAYAVSHTSSIVWNLRQPGRYYSRVCYVNSRGGVDAEGGSTYSGTSGGYGVRPVLWMNY